MGLFKKIGKAIGKVGKTLGKGVGLLAKGALAIGKTVLGVGGDEDTKAAKAAAKTYQSFQELADLQKAQMQAQASGGLAGGASNLKSGGQSGFQSRFQMAIVWDWLKTNWYVPVAAILIIFGLIFWRGQASGSRKYKRR